MIAAALIASLVVDPALEATLTGLARSGPGTVGISVVHVESGAGAAVNGGERFPMMSVYKLPIVLEAPTWRVPHPGAHGVAARSDAANARP